MTAAEIDEILKDAHLAGRDLPHALARVVADQERRLRALEPCAGRGNLDLPHEWGVDMAKGACVWCGIRKSGS